LTNSKAAMITRDGERRGRIVRRILVVVRLISSDALLASMCRGAVCKVDTVSHGPHSAHDSETDRLFPCLERIYGTTLEPRLRSMAIFKS
jgi:hypothetical protein